MYNVAVARLSNLHGNHHNGIHIGGIGTTEQMIGVVAMVASLASTAAMANRSVFLLDLFFNLHDHTQWKLNKWL